jgi:hypothetical protein
MNDGIMGALDAEDIRRIFNAFIELYRQSIASARRLSDEELDRLREPSGA